MEWIFAVIDWDPSRELCVVPFLNRPIGWYGALFAFGFFVGYFIISALFRRRLLVTGEVTAAQIAHWPKLIFLLQQASEDPKEPLYRVLSLLDPKQKELLLQMNKGVSPDLRLKEALLHALNRFLDFPETERKNNRIFLENSLPKALMTTSEVAAAMADALCWFAVAGTVVGARLGHVIFYSWPYYKNHLLDILKVWEGGLASHGGAVGVLIALWLYLKVARRYYPSISWIEMVDLVCIPTAFVGFCIRLGNFFNQEIVGIPSAMPWAVRFGHPVEGEDLVARHAVQLYESLSYLLIFIVLVVVWRRYAEKLAHGAFSGLFFVSVFASRFMWEFFKESQGGSLALGYFQTGQLLSIPFILWGVYLLWRARPSFFVAVQTPLLRRDI